MMILSIIAMSFLPTVLFLTMLLLSMTSKGRDSGPVDSTLRTHPLLTPTYLNTYAVGQGMQMCGVAVRHGHQVGRLGVGCVERNDVPLECNCSPNSDRGACAQERHGALQERSDALPDSINNLFISGQKGGWIP
ncbi:unnamed protein product [Citrullus colocynthis]|uniref:Uncharacterized protein n=1 Tax=Citrullus colocynthis TaxID=252529 RepID=A0ABP0XVN2_9ROSI